MAPQTVSRRRPLLCTAGPICPPHPSIPGLHTQISPSMQVSKNDMLCTRLCTCCTLCPLLCTLHSALHIVALCRWSGCTALSKLQFAVCTAQPIIQWFHCYLSFCYLFLRHTANNEISPLYQIRRSLQVIIYPTWQETPGRSPIVQQSV